LFTPAPPTIADFVGPYITGGGSAVRKINFLHSAAKRQAIQNFELTPFSDMNNSVVDPMILGCEIVDIDALGGAKATALGAARVAARARAIQVFFIFITTSCDSL
jgi:hypothetical protein